MIKRINNTIFFPNLPRIANTCSFVGKKECEGPLGAFFDGVVPNGRFGENSWEKAESKMQKQTISTLLRKETLPKNKIDIIFGGDLLNQCMGTSFGLLNFEIPFFGLYGACSTFCEGLCLSAMAVDGGYGTNVIAVTSSHFCSSERQFRFPLEYGNQRPLSATWNWHPPGIAVARTAIMPPASMAFDALSTKLYSTDFTRSGSNTTRFCSALQTSRMPLFFILGASARSTSAR